MNDTLYIPERTLTHLDLSAIGTWEGLQIFTGDLLKLIDTVNDSREYLKKGNDQEGIDVFATTNIDDRWIVAQCKYRKEMFPGEIQLVFSKFLENEEMVARSAKFILCTNIDLREKKREEAIDEGRKLLSAKGVDFELWDYEGVNRILRLNSDQSAIELVCRHFSHAAAAAFYGTLYTKYLKDRLKVDKKCYSQPTDYIDREVVPISDYYKGYPYMYYRESKEKQLFTAAIESNKKTSRFMLLSVGGFGKTIELEQVAHYFSSANTRFFPIKHLLRDYTGQSIREIIETQKIPFEQIVDEDLLLIFDGLDEIGGNHFDNFINQLNLFSDANEKVNIIISSRFNFYEHSGNSLRNFETYILEEFSEKDIDQYIQIKIPSDIQRFRERIKESGINDYLNNPYYLARMVRFFDQRIQNFPDTKSDFFDRILYERLDEEQAKYKTDIDREYLTSLVRKVAFCMTLSGLSVIGDRDLLSIVGSSAELEKLQRYFLMNRHSEVLDQWSFEHKNLQEFLAAKCFQMMGMEELIEKMSFGKQLRRIQPKYYNTISFLFSLPETKDGLNQSLFDWLMLNEPEAIFRFEKSRLTAGIRMSVLEKILTYYSSKGMFLYVNGLTIREIATFVGIDANAVSYLSKFISSKNLPDRMVMDIVELLTYTTRAWVLQEELEQILFDLLNDVSRSPDLHAEVIDGLSKLNFDDERQFKRLLGINTLKLDDFNIRKAMVDFIAQRDYADAYLGFLLDSVPVFINGQRGATHFSANESLSTAILNATNDQNVPLLLRFLRHNNRYEFSGNGDEFSMELVEFRQVLEKSVAAFPRLPVVVPLVYAVYRKMEYVSMEDQWMEAILSFFKETCGSARIFHHMRKYNIELYYVAKFADEEICNQLITDYSNGHIKEPELINLRTGLRGGKLHDYFYERLILEFGDIFKYANHGIDYQQIRNDYEVRNQGMLLDRTRFISECEFIFNLINKGDEIGRKDIDFRTNSLLEANSVSLAYQTMHKMMLRGELVSLDKIRLRFTDDDWTYFQMEKVKELVNKLGLKKVKVELLELAQKWCLEQVQKLDFSQTITEQDDGRMLVDWFRNFVSELVQLLDLEMEDGHWLSLLYTEFKDYHKNESSISRMVLDKVQDRDGLKNRILSNLRTGRLARTCRNSHFQICVELGFIEILPYLFGEIKLAKSTNERRKLSELYLKLGGKIDDFRLFVKTPMSIENERISEYSSWEWYLLTKFMELEPDYVEPFFLEVMQDTSREFEDRLEASRSLIALGNIEGLKFWRDGIVAGKYIQFRLNLVHQKLLTDKKVEELMLDFLELVYSTGIFKSYKKMDRIEKRIVEALTSIALASTDSFDRIIVKMDTLYNKYSANDFAMDISYQTENVKAQYFNGSKQAVELADSLRQYNAIVWKG